MRSTKKRSKKQKVKYGYWNSSDDVLPFEVPYDDVKKARKVVEGNTYKVEGTLKICENGLHAADTYDLACSYRKPFSPFEDTKTRGVACYVKIWGDLKDDRRSSFSEGKFCGRYRQVLAMVSAKKVEAAIRKKTGNQFYSLTTVDMEQALKKRIALRTRKPAKGKLSKQTMEMLSYRMQDHYGHNIQGDLRKKVLAWRKKQGLE